MSPRTLPAAALACLLATAPAALAAQAPLELSLLRGGALQADPVASERLVYFPTGRTVATWDYADPAAPRRLATSEPVGGVINGLVRRDGHLYASWRGHDGSSGVATWSLADPAAPALVDDSQDYDDGAQKFALGLVLANERLYLFDNNRGVFVSDLADPARPSFTRSAIDSVPFQYSRLVAHGDTIHATGRNWIGGTVLDLYDVGVPDAPRRIASHGTDGLDSFSLLPEPARAIGVGNRLTVFDLSDPDLLQPRGAIDIPPAIAGARAGDHVYTFGWGEGLDVWNIADPDAPHAAGHLDILALGTRRSLALDGLLLLPGETDLVHALDTAVPAAPERLSTGWLPGGVDARDIVALGDRIALLQANYGLTVNDPATLVPVARLDADLPQRLENRSFEQMAISGDTAWLAAWGYGLIAVDLSDPAAPVERGRLAFPFAAVLDVAGNHAYVASWTNGGALGVADVSDPDAPALIWQGALDAQPYALRIHGGHAWLAEGWQPGTATGGLRVYSLEDPASPVEAAHLDDGCGSAFDLAIDAEVSLLYLACGGGLQVIDIAEPATPVVVGRYDSGGDDQYTRVAQRLDRAWFADIDGLHELDVSDPTAPVRTRLTALGQQGVQRLAALEDGRLYALGGASGVHVFAPGDGGGATPIDNRVPVRVPDGDAGDERIYAIELPEGVAALTALSYGGRGDVSLELRHGQPPGADGHDGRSSRPGNNEQVRIAHPAAGRWYIRVVGESAFSGVTLQARF
ncbi:pre-peptidase C-terminal domain-containing protein [Luteimonas sp. SJ-92]|uniref:Pre-peptidase C-terminal domain-containing protein n=1 Tax=Luteimonas salinisoli TaxID=2752307 RepID=A0A853JGA1_9GAMM|nr:pre-peptidase C-terminal domain-containing protein [Luteimonas salinisoli]NZA27752.1 pre-peptidase C-terminal domain-containing protein [Luteimonas salinisoli]